MMMNTSMAPQSEDYGDSGMLSWNNSDINTGDNFVFDLTFYIEIIILVTCCAGFMGNVAAIWLLGFRIKRNPFTTYILNLAVADTGVLTAISSSRILLRAGNYAFILDITLYLFLLMFLTSQLLLTAISIDRCVSMFFPIWHRCHRPNCLSAAVCALLWSHSFLLFGIIFTLDIANIFGSVHVAVYHILATSFFCFPLTTVSAVILSIKFCFKSHQWQRGKLLTNILLTLLFFCMLDFPLNALVVINFFFEGVVHNLFIYAYLCACLNSSVNPLIYFLVGRKKQDQSKKNTAEGLRQRGRLKTEKGRQIILMETHI